MMRGPLPLARRSTNIPTHHLSLMGYVNRFKANGSGGRAVIWEQDC